MDGLKLVCLRLALALALVGAIAPAPVAAEADPWPAIRQSYREGDFAPALERLKHLLALNADDREALYYTAIIQWRLERYEEAAAAYRRVLTLDPEGPFGQDAKLWLATYGERAAPIETPSPVPTPVPLPSVAARPPASASPPGPQAAPWLQAQPQSKNRRARSANARPGYFKGADGSFEFVPPVGFVLLAEGTQGSEISTIFGLQKAASGAETPPTLLITWREFDELQPLKPDQRAARERQLLAMEASMYGPGATVEGRFGGPCYRVRQAQGAWAADTLLFFQHRKLYAVTFGGAAALLERHRPHVEKSLQTPIFYP